MASPADSGVSPLRDLWLPWITREVAAAAWGDSPVPSPQVTFADVLRAARLYDKQAKNGPQPRGRTASFVVIDDPVIPSPESPA